MNEADPIMRKQGEVPEFIDRARKESDGPRSHVRLAPCGRCRRLIRRNDLFSLNPQWWDKGNTCTRIRIRLCPQCFNQVTGFLRDMEWDNRDMLELPRAVNGEVG